MLRVCKWVDSSQFLKRISSQLVKLLTWLYLLTECVLTAQTSEGNSTALETEVCHVTHLECTCVESVSDRPALIRSTITDVRGSYWPTGEEVHSNKHSDDETWRTFRLLTVPLPCFYLLPRHKLSFETLNIQKFILWNRFENELLL